ncbi:MAG: type II toxin-antitoxin system PemK/MazF family toxin [Propionibacteriaceae bacterium]|nr:type II toxin-antitoxin system PemK/MazF family toxin [Propionibacteriaceae bacterium]
MPDYAKLLGQVARAVFDAYAKSKPSQGGRTTSSTANATGSTTSATAGAAPTATRGQAPSSASTAGSGASQSTAKGRKTATPPLSMNYPGDYPGVPQLTYDPHSDNQPDPGEVVWAWIPYEEDYSQGKDRPALVVGKDGAWFLALMLTSQDHDLDRAQENREGRYWVEIGSGPWDSQGRVSEARVNRIVRVNPNTVRRIGGRLDEAVFDKVAAGIRAHPPTA